MMDDDDRAEFSRECRRDSRRRRFDLQLDTHIMRGDL